MLVENSMNIRALRKEQISGYIFCLKNDKYGRQQQAADRNLKILHSFGCLSSNRLLDTTYNTSGIISNISCNRKLQSIIIMRYII